MLPPNSPYPSHPQPNAWPFKPAKPITLPRWDTGAYAAQESMRPWVKLIVWALGVPHAPGVLPRRFASVFVPTIWAEQLARVFRGQGFTTRLSDGLSEQSRLLSVWLAKEALAPAQGRWEGKEEGI